MMPLDRAECVHLKIDDEGDAGKIRDVAVVMNEEFSLPPAKFQLRSANAGEAVRFIKLPDTVDEMRQLRKLF